MRGEHDGDSTAYRDADINPASLYDCMTCPANITALSSVITMHYVEYPDSHRERTAV